MLLLVLRFQQGIWSSLSKYTHDATLSYIRYVADMTVPPTLMYQRV